MATPPKTPKPASAKSAAASQHRVEERVAAKPAEDSVPPAEIAAQSVEAATQAVEAAAASVAEEAITPVKALPVAKVADVSEEKMMKGVQTFLEFGRDNAILLVSAGNELALGLHKLSQSLIDWSAESCDKSVAGASALLSAKTVEEVIDLSQELARDGFQQILKESSELGSLSTRLFENALVPLPARMVAAVEKLAAHTH